MGVGKRKSKATKKKGSPVHVARTNDTEVSPWNRTAWLLQQPIMKDANAAPTLRMVFLTPDVQILWCSQLWLPYFQHLIR